MTKQEYLAEMHRRYLLAEKEIKEIMAREKEKEAEEDKSESR